MKQGPENYGNALLTAGVMLLLLMILVSSCKHDIPEPVFNDANNGGGYGFIPCDSDSVYFSQQVLPFLVANCAMSGCHDPVSAKDGVVLNSYQTVMNSGIIVPGNASGSGIMDVLTTGNAGDRMPPPPSAPLPQAQISLIRTWINQGARNLSCENAACDTANVTWTASIQPIIQQKCQGCHQGAAPGGGISLQTYNDVRLTAIDSSLRGVVEHQPGWSAMPKGTARLPECDLAKIRIWVEAGAPNN